MGIDISYLLQYKIFGSNLLDKYNVIWYFGCVLQTEVTVPVLLMKAKVDGVISYPLPSLSDPMMIAMSAQDMLIQLEPGYGSPEAIKLEVGDTVLRQRISIFDRAVINSTNTK